MTAGDVFTIVHGARGHARDNSFGALNLRDRKSVV